MKKIAKLPVVLLTCAGVFFCASTAACKKSQNSETLNDTEVPAAQAPEQTPATKPQEKPEHVHEYDEQNYGKDGE